MNQSERGPVLFTTLYVIGLVLTWITLLSLERFGATEVRSWAPLIQAVLSAIAIFSAWFLQERKRRADRQDSERDQASTYVHIINAIEFMVEHCAYLDVEGRVTAINISLALKSLTPLQELLLKQNLAHLPHDEARKAVIGVYVELSNVMVALEIQQKKLVDKPGSHVVPNAIFIDRYAAIVKAVDRVLVQLAVNPRPHRVSANSLRADAAARQLAKDGPEVPA